MVSEMCLDPRGHWSVGRVHVNVFQPESQLDQECDIQVLLHGEIFHEGSLELDTDGNDDRGRGKGAAWWLRQLYLHHGHHCFARLEGTFSAAVVDSKSRKVMLATDYLGSYPLYWFHAPGLLIFASEVKSILNDSSVSREVNLLAIADFLTFGFLLGDKTLASSVRLLPAGSMLTYWWEEDRWEIEAYEQIGSYFQPWEGARSDYMDAVTQAFNRAVVRGMRGNFHYGLSLSGGLDSRTLLSAVPEDSVDLGTYTLGETGCADEVIAQTLSTLVHTRHVFHAIDSEYLGEFVPNIRDMVRLTDGMYLTHGITEMLAHRIIKAQGYTVLLRGHGAELAKMRLAWPLQTDAHIWKMRTKEEFMAYLLQRVNYISPGLAWQDLISDTCTLDLREAAACSLKASLGHLPLSPPDLCSYLYAMEHHRRYTVASLEIFRDVVEVRLPFVDREFLRLLWKGRPEWRDGTDIHRAILARNHPKFLTIRNSNTGAPAGAGPLVECVYDKINSLFKRLNLYGFRHYHNYEVWMREELSQAVEEVVLNRDSITGSFWRKETLRHLLQETRQGRRNYGYLFQILLILELWQQEFT